MSTLGLANALVGLFVPIGVAGAVIALACALLAAFAIARGAAGLAGGAIGVWIVGAVMSISASFAAQWTPFLIAAVALGAALVVGGLVRLALVPVRARRAHRSVLTASELDVAKAPAPASTSRASGHSTDVAVA